MAILYSVNDINRERLIQFLNIDDRLDNTSYWEARLAHWWDSNPASNEGSSRGWVLIENNRIIGCFLLIPQRFDIFGREHTVYAASTWRVNPDRRGESLKLLQAIHDTVKDTVLFDTTPTPAVTKILEALKYREVERGVAPKYAVLPLNVKKALAYLFPNKPYVQISGRLLQPAAAIYRHMNRWRLSRRSKASVHGTAEIGQEFDDLWARSKSLVDAKIVRDSKFIRWMYSQQSPYEKDIVAITIDGVLSGYALFWLRRYGQITFYECLDIWGDFHLPEFRSSIYNVVLSAIERAQLHEAHIISFPLFCREHTEMLGSSGMFWVNAKQKHYFRANTELTSLMKKGTSYYSYALGDMGI